MVNKKLLERAYREVFEYAPDIELEVPEGTIRLLERYLWLVVLEKFNKEPLRWYPSGKRVYTWWFRWRVFLNKMIAYMKFYWWLLGQKGAFRRFLLTWWGFYLCILIPESIAGGIICAVLHFALWTSAILGCVLGYVQSRIWQSIRRKYTAHD